MPWMLHKIGGEPEHGVSYATRDEALAARVDGYTVSRLVTNEESCAWRQREAERFYDGTYTRVPWHNTLESINRYRTGDEQTTAARMLDHFAHVSLDNPGMIAYTADEAKGVDDKQMRVKPGKYLTEFGASIFSAEEILKFASHVKAFTAGVQFAKTANEIARVYVSGHGFNSCMDARNFDYDDTPVRAYAYKDLAVAYIGSLDETSERPTSKDRVLARAVVWPDKKLYSRVYGEEELLEKALQSLGYVAGGMRGARIAAIESSRGRYVMPYVDCCSYADLKTDEDGNEYFVLGRGDYDTKPTCGYTGDSGNTCSNCGEECDEDESYCRSCEESSYFCDSCEETRFRRTHGARCTDSPNCHDHGTLCDSCDSDHSHTCEHCEESFNDYDFSRGTRRSRDNRLCGSCEDEVTMCEDCDTWTENDSIREIGSSSVCEDCARKRSLQAPRPRGRLLRRHAAGSSYVNVTPDGPMPLVVQATVLDHFAVHPSLTGDRIGLTTNWTVTHVPTGRSIITYARNRDEALRLVSRLRQDPQPWIETDSTTVETVHGEYARQQKAKWRQTFGHNRY